jgi:hypothetical protein
VEQLITALKIRGVLLKFIWKKGKEGPRFLPVDIPITDFRNQKPAQPQQEDKASKKQRKKQSKPEEEEDLSSKNSFGDLTGYDDEDPSKLAMPKPPTPKPVQEEKLSVAEAAERFKIGIENPNSSIEMDQNKLRTLGEEELRDYLSQVLTPYLFEHYSDNAETLLAKIMEMNNFGIVDMIKTENELSQLAKSMGIYPADRFNKDSPLKVRGNPLSSNVHRVYELRCTKAEVGRATVSTIMPMVLGKLFPLVSSLGGHSIKLIPFHPNSTEEEYWDFVLIEKNANILAGVYATNIITHPWNKRLMWDFKVVTTLDLSYLLNRSNSRGSNQCGA